MNAATTTYQGKLDEVEVENANEQTEHVYIIALERPACLPASADVKETAEVHIFSTDLKVRAQLKELKGKLVVATGDGFVWHTAHHFRPIVVDLKSIAAK